MPARNICLEQNLIPGTHVSGNLLRRLLAYNIPKMIPIINGLNEKCFMNGTSAK